MREPKDWNRSRKDHKLPPEKLFEILDRMYGGDEARKAFKNLTGLDSPEVIFCGDCKYSSPNGLYGCRIHSFADDLDERLYAGDFYSRAERRDGSV